MVSLPQPCRHCGTPLYNYSGSCHNTECKKPDADLQTTNHWRETVRDIFDTLHHGEDDIFTGSRLAKRLVAMIEDRHHDFFCEEAESDD